jgi:hypothetical protein
VAGSFIVRLRGPVDGKALSLVPRAKGCLVVVPPTGVRVLIATKPADFRKGMDGLAAYAKEAFKADLFSGVISVSRAKQQHHPARLARLDTHEARQPLASRSHR